jgi:hypothetical protein
VVLAPNAGAGGIRLFAAGNSNGTVIESANVAPIAVAVSRTRDATGAFSNESSDFVVYEKGGSILQVNLAASASATSATPVSNETQACGAGTLYQNDPNAGLAVYVYSSGGPDATCATNDDVRRAVQLSMSSTDAPLTVPSTESIVSALSDGSGALVGWLTFDGTTLNRYDVNFTNRQSVANGALSALPDPPVSQDANGVLFAIGGVLRYYSISANTLGSATYTQATGAQFGVFQHDATRTFFTESDTTQTRILALPTSGGTATLLQQQTGNTANSLALTANRVIYQLPDGTVRSIAKDGADALNLRAPTAGAVLSFAAINSAVVITETTTQPTMFIYAEAGATPIGTNGVNTELSGFTKNSSGNLFGNDLSKIIAVRRLNNTATDASGTLISLDPSSAVEVTLGTLSTADVSFVTDPLQAGDFTTGYSLSAAGGSVQRLFTFNAATPSSLFVAQ